MEILGKAVLIKPDELPETTRGGLIVPKTAKEKPNKGLVIDAGHACTEVRRNDRVHYVRKAASILIIDDIEHHLVFEDKILYIE
ncbi:MAG: 10 kDa chaperonin [Bacteroidetes bacterium ADurb.BinA104]|nr:MAG: 10 kDa chaperonin [Bacteroidetes bacterium ADurb.BinA104]